MTTLQHECRQLHCSGSVSLIEKKASKKEWKGAFFNVAILLALFYLVISYTQSLPHRAVRRP